MTTRGRWQNEEMWRQAVERHKGGMTYRRIEAWLSRSEVKERFGLQEVPSEDTVRREVQKRLAGSTLPGLPILNLDEPKAGLWTDYKTAARFVTMLVSNQSNVIARECWGTVSVLLPPERTDTLELHWAGAEPSSHEVGVPRIAILPGLSARLDVAFTHSMKEGKRPTGAMTCGVISMVSYPTDGPARLAPAGTPDLPQEGCWLAWPMAMFNPLAGERAYLAPGRYQVQVTVGCDGGQEKSRAFWLQSPARGQELQVELP